MFALGELGLKPWEFELYTWSEYCYYSHGYFVRRARESELLRLLTTITYNANRGKDAKPLSPHEILPLITDKPATKRSTLTPEQRKQKAKEAEEKLNKKLREKNERSSLKG